MWWQNSRGVKGVGDTFLKEAVRLGLMEKGSSEQRPEGEEERRLVGEEDFRQGNNKWMDIFLEQEAGQSGHSRWVIGEK